MSKVDLYFDGACRNVKGSTVEPFGYGVAVLVDGVYSEDFSLSKYGAYGTSNVAEWYGLILAFEIVKEFRNIQKDHSDIELEFQIFSDSQLVVNQFNGIWQIKEFRFLELNEIARELSREVNFMNDIIWVSRDKNIQADKLSKRGLHTYRELNGLT